MTTTWLCSSTTRGASGTADDEARSRAVQMSRWPESRSANLSIRIKQFPLAETYGSPPSVPADLCACGLLAGEREPPQFAIGPSRAIGWQVGEVHVVTLSQDVRIVSDSHGRGISRDRIEGAEHSESRPVQRVDGFGVVERRVVGEDHHI